MLRLTFFAVTLSLCAPAAVRFSTASQVLDLRLHEWQYILEADSATEAQAMARADWKPIRVGQRWDEMGYPELKRGNVWLRISFTADASLRGRSVGFFATLIDDEADIFLNGRQVSSVKYMLGALVNKPAIAHLTKHVRIGEENTLLLHLRDTYVRSPGVIGNVCLFQTLPFQRTTNGGISVQAPGPLSVSLHLGDALLSRADATGFSAADLADLAVPPYILRDDELVLVIPQAEITHAPALRVDLGVVNPIRSRLPLAVRAAALPSTIPRFGLLDLPLDLAASYDNPFDPSQVSVQAFIETPSGRIDKIPAFFRQDFRQVAPSDEEEILIPVKGPAWRLYYRPRELGVHKVEIIAQDRSGIRKHDAGRFESVPSQLPGYLRVSKRDPNFFEYDNGESFYGIGPSGWYRGRDFIFGGATRWVSSRKIEQYYERKAANRSTYEYLGTFHFGQLLTKGGIVDQHIAWKLEHSLRTMERLGIRWLFFHDDILRMSKYGLDALPYAASNGGPVADLNEVYFNEAALAMQKNELRYVVGRMADSPSLWIWNIGDEWRGHPGARFSVPMVRAWIKELHATVKELDVYGHPHAIGEGKESMLNGGDVYLFEDWYLREAIGPISDPVRKKRDIFEFVPAQTAGVGERSFPAINVEGGIYGWNASIYQSGKPWGYPEAITFHQHLWMGFFLKNAASGTDWMVNILDNDKQLFHARALAQYLDGENLVVKPFRALTPAATDARLTAFALQNDDKTLAWIVNGTWNWQDFVNGVKPVPSAGQSLSVPVAAPGTYRVEFWNTSSGTVESTVSLSAATQTLTVPLPEVTTDIALKIRAAQ